MQIQRTYKDSITAIFSLFLIIKTERGQKKHIVFYLNTRLNCFNAQ